KDALPVLEKLVERNPPDPDALFIAARIGESGLPLLKKSLTNSTAQEFKVIRTGARVCLDMMESHSPGLYPAPGPDPSSSEFMSRNCLFHAAILKASWSEFIAQHPELRAL